MLNLQSKLEKKRQLSNDRKYSDLYQYGTFLEVFGMK